LNKELDLRVKDRTRELEKAMEEREETFRELLEVRTRAEDKLMNALAAEQKAANELRDADSMRAAFLMAISHELRTPLTAVIGFSTMLNDALDDFSHEEIADSIASIAKQSQRLERLLMDLLDIERLTRGTIEPRLAETDVGGLVRAVTERTSNGRRMWVAVEPELRAVIDPALTERILENLIVNANKHPPVGTQVFVIARRQGSDLQLSVEDDGQGVPDEIKERIFEPFEQGMVQQHSPGTGVGLALVSKVHGAARRSRVGGGQSRRRGGVPCRVPGSRGRPAARASCSEHGRGLTLTQGVSCAFCGGTASGRWCEVSRHRYHIQD
jgi:K+-sensing histidine kinase KdpD